MNKMTERPVPHIDGILKETIGFDCDFDESLSDVNCVYTGDGHYLGRVRYMELMWKFNNQSIYWFEKIPDQEGTPYVHDLHYVYFDYSEKKFRIFKFTDSKFVPSGAETILKAIKDDYLKLAHSSFLSHFIHGKDLARHQRRLMDAYMRAYSYFDPNNANLDFICSLNYYEFESGSHQTIKLENSVKVRVNRKSKIYPENGLTASEIKIWRNNNPKIPVANGTSFEVSPSNLTFTVINTSTENQTLRDIVFDPKYKEMILSVFRPPQSFYDKDIFDERYRELVIDHDTDIPGTPG